MHGGILAVGLSGGTNFPPGAVAYTGDTQEIDPRLAKEQNRPSVLFRDWKNTGTRDKLRFCRYIGCSKRRMNP
jgi:hypothetical protein